MTWSHRNRFMADREELMPARILSSTVLDFIYCLLCCYVVVMYCFTLVSYCFINDIWSNGIF